MLSRQRNHGWFEEVGNWLWWLRHPSTRRCPRCRLDWEQRSQMRAQGGVCSDCHGNDIVDGLDADAYRDWLRMAR